MRILFSKPNGYTLLAATFLLIFLAALVGCSTQTIGNQTETAVPDVICEKSDTYQEQKQGNPGETQSYQDDGKVYIYGDFYLSLPENMECKVYYDDSVKIYFNKPLWDGFNEKYPQFTFKLKEMSLKRWIDYWDFHSLEDSVVVEGLFGECKFHEFKYEQENKKGFFIFCTMRGNWVIEMICRLDTSSDFQKSVVAEVLESIRKIK